MASRSLLPLLLGTLGALCYHKAYGISVKTDNQHVTAKEFQGAPDRPHQGRTGAPMSAQVPPTNLTKVGREHPQDDDDG